MSKADKDKSTTARRRPRPVPPTAPEARTPDDIVLVHLSDLHFGDTHRFPISDSSQRKALGIRFGRAIKQAATALGASVERALVMVTGDISNAGQPDEFDVAVEVFQGLGGELGIGNHRFVLCPGNHDIDWFESEVAEIQGKQRKFSPARAREDLDLRKLNNNDPPKTQRSNRQGAKAPRNSGAWRLGALAVHLSLGTWRPVVLNHTVRAPSTNTLK